MSTITQLSDELLLEIFQYLSFPDICRVGAVNKKFNAISVDEDLWRHHPNILLALPNEAEFSRILVGRVHETSVTSKNLAKLRGAWNTYSLNITKAQEARPLPLAQPQIFSVQSIFDMIALPFVSKIELFQFLGTQKVSENSTSELTSPNKREKSFKLEGTELLAQKNPRNLITVLNPLQVAKEILSTSGWLGLFDGVGPKFLLGLYLRTTIPQRYPILDSLVQWTATAASAFLQTRTIPTKAHIPKFIGAGTVSVLRRYLWRRIIAVFFSRRRRSDFVIPAIIAYYASVPISGFALCMLLGNNPARETFTRVMKSMLSWKMWFSTTIGVGIMVVRALFRFAALKAYDNWKKRSLQEKEKQKFLRLLDLDPTRLQTK